jgi:hypothetical protein
MQNCDPISIGAAGCIARKNASARHPEPLAEAQLQPSTDTLSLNPMDPDMVLEPTRKYTLLARLPATVGKVPKRRCC